MMQYDFKLVRDFFLDREQILKFVDMIVDRAYPEEEAEAKGLTERGQKILVTLATEQVRTNFETIYRYARSPIEKIFLGCLHMNFAMYDPLHVEFTAPIEGETFPDYLRENHEAALYMWEQYQQDTEGSTNVFEFLDIFKDMPNVADEVRSRISRHIILYHMFGLYDKYHLTLQPKFASLKVNGRGIRTDLFVWKPSKPNFKLIVECDGYQHHSSKEAFSRDRARDRMLQSKGYNVFRFSGQEIYSDPIGQSKELFDYLVHLEGEDMRCHIDCCVTMYNEKTLNPFQT